MSKKYTGKTCAYCALPGVSSTRDHVLAREFFLKKDRHHLPIVPACRKCNGEKSSLETYILAVLPFGSRHEDARAYAELNLERRLLRNRALKESLILRRDGSWEAHPNGLMVPASSLPVDTAKVYRLFSMVIRGLFMHHWNVALDPEWYVDVQMFDPRGERQVIQDVINKIVGPVSQTEKGNFGRGTFVYEAMRSAAVAELSLWQFSIFGGLQFGGDNSRLRLSRFYAVTRPNVKMSAAPRESLSSGAIPKKA